MTRTVSCFPNSYGRFGAAACIERVRSSGITHIELPIKTDGIPSIFGEQPILTDRSTPADVERVQALLARHQVQLASCNISSGNPLDEASVAVTLQKLKLAASLGVSLVVGGAGQADGAESRDRLIAHLKRIGDAAADVGIVYCFETHPGLCQNARTMLDTMSALDHLHLRINFDTGNILYYNAGADVLEELKQVRHWVRHVHLKDHNGVPEDWHFPACGAAGAVDFRGVRELLDEVGFAGPYSLEIEGIQGETPLTVEEHHQRVVDSVAWLRAQGYDIPPPPLSA